MVTMDPGIELTRLIDEFRFGDSLPPLSPPPVPVPSSLPIHNFGNTFRLDTQSPCPNCCTNHAVPPQVDLETSYSETEESDITLSYIRRMLLEEDNMMEEDKFNVPLGDSDLLAVEKPFLEILGQDYPPLSHVEYGLPTTPDTNSSNSTVHSTLIDDHPSPPYSLTSFDSNNTIILDAHYTQSKSLPVWNFNKGVEEASKFLPDYDNLFHQCKIKAEEENRHHDVFNSILSGRKKSYNDILDGEDDEGRRSIKQPAFSFSSRESIQSELFDEVLLCPHGEMNQDGISKLREDLKSKITRNGSDTKRVSSRGGKSKSKKKNVKSKNKDVVDLRTLLIHCAQSVAADDHRTASDILKQIRQHSSAYGDGSQRLAHIFADCLEARLAGNGSQIYHSLVAKWQSATDTLKAHHLYHAACPFRKISHFFANRNIINLADKAKRMKNNTIHIIDFGIYFGFQWPCLIQRLSLLPGGPPKLRITGIDVPQPGFRPNERIEETGRRLAGYADRFNVPFEYHPIASKWEKIEIEDLKVDNNNEVVVVNCLYKLRNLVDETVVAVDSPRNVVLNKIKKLNPNVFIQGVVNGAYSAPFFVTRFREALFHFSCSFDMLEATVPREHPERLLIEKEIYGREAMNVIACEGSERVERPEIYKQWQVRNQRAGYIQLPLNKEILKESKDKVHSCYHKDFVIDTDGRWLVQGWKGRIIYAISAWKP